jgi:hypothetical protein
MDIDVYLGSFGSRDPKPTGLPKASIFHSSSDPPELSVTGDQNLTMQVAGPPTRSNGPIAGSRLLG